ncbi:MAG: AAA family ATPase, partial [Planctomycetota bacterium]
MTKVSTTGLIRRRRNYGHACEEPPLQIERFDIIRFAHLSDVTLDFHGGDRDGPMLEIVYGANEAGKSTTLRALHRWLFGFPHHLDDNFLHAGPRLRLGGRLRTRSGRTIEFIRKRGRKGTLLDPETERVLPDDGLRPFLGKLDQQSFSTRHGLSHDELQRGGRDIINGDGQWGQILFAAGAGVGHLRDVQSSLTDELGKLFKRQGKSQIKSLIELVNATHKRVRELQLSTSTYQQLQTQLDAQEQRVHSLEERQLEILRDIERLEVIEQTLPLIPEWEAVNATLESVRDAVDLDDPFVSQFRVCQMRVIELRQQRVAIDEENQRLEDRRKSLGPADPVLDDAVEIEALQSNASVHRHELSEQATRRREIEQCDLDIARCLRMLGRDADDDSTNPLQVTDPARRRIQELAQDYRRVRQRCDDAEQAVAATQTRIKGIENQLGEMVSLGDPDLLTSILNDIGRIEDWSENLAQRQAEVRSSNEACTNLAKNLRQHGCESNLETLRTPHDSQIKSLASQLQAADEACRRVDEELKQKEQTLAEQLQAIRHRAVIEKLPTAQQLSAARKTRDDVIKQSLPSAINSENTDQQALWSSVRHADELSDQIATHQAQIQSHQLAMQEIEQAQSDVESLRQHRERVVQERKRAQEAWDEIWLAIDVATGSPEVMQAWIDDHQRYLSLCDHHREQRQRLAAVQQKTRDVIERLASSVGESAPSTSSAGKAATSDSDDDPPGGDDLAIELARWHDKVQHRRNEWALRADQIQKQQQRLDQFREKLVDEQSSLQARQDAIEAWQCDWNEAIAPLIEKAKSWQPSEMLPTLDVINDLTHYRDEHRRLSQRYSD